MLKRNNYQEGYTTSPPPPQKNIDEANISDISEEIDGDQTSGTIYNDPRDVSSSLISIIEEYRKKDSNRNLSNPAHSYILDLTATSKIIKRFYTGTLVNVEYHKELDSIFDYLFGQQKGKRSTIKNIQQARIQWKNLRNIEPPEYKKEFSYDKDDWEKILWWIEWAVGRLLITYLQYFSNKELPLIRQNTKINFKC
ncbi:hypothetical protein C1645_873574 [Glomus cerebriforme]|uniref:Uncharacterized protein n=1 Tax=Glomus cerebriforme TaxID=658196 RepID=A0A397T7R2_9GLOM|nr:hypothetical protein C1645_873574 [Glomus cerebriforme]